MARVFLLVLDSVGVGGAPDAADYGDAGSNTLGHIADACACGEGDLPGRRFGHLHLPNLARLGLGEAARLATGKLPADLLCPDGPKARIAAAAEVSAGKDTPSGHWEIAGLPVRFQWGMFPRAEPCFPATLTDALCAQAGLPGVLGNKHASGTTIIEELGAEHMRSGRLICYTSADSVLQIAAHEEFFGLDRLLEVCAVARRLVDPLNIGRVIARPFTGSPGSGFRRTANRRDFSVPPFGPTLLDLAVAGGREVVTIGKIGDIFAHTGTGHEVKADGNDAVVNATLDTMSGVADGGFVFANLVDFDSLYGHRRDVGGYAEALEAFDARVPELLGRLRSGDLLIITADHGCDPTWAGTDHTREQVPILAFEPGRSGGSIGRRSTFADIAATAARHLGLPAPQAGSPL